MMLCPKCSSEKIRKDGNHNEMQRYKCISCNKTFDSGKYKSNVEYVIHFGVKIKKNDKNLLSKENYCTKTNIINYVDRKNIKLAQNYYKENKKYPLLCPSWYQNIPNDLFADYEHYTNKYVEKHYYNCMLNFDLNMNYFNSIDYDEFNNYLMKFIKKNKLIKVKDLNKLKEKEGIYILVLDKYKQVYIGKSESIKGMKNRILSHWRNKKEFRNLIHGNVETSILSIDSFGALDTTRTFYREFKYYQDIDIYEEKFVNQFKSEYRLNRVAGGINSEQNPVIRNIKLIGSIQNRKLK